jgi:hypothetical protein
MQLKPATIAQADALRIALTMLREARNLLANANCPKTLARVRLAISSAKGAERHIDRRRQRTKEAAGYFAAFPASVLDSIARCQPETPRGIAAATELRARKVTQ